MKKIILSLLLILCVSFESVADPAIQGHVLPLVTVNTAQHKVLRESAKPITFPLDKTAQQTIADLKATFESLKSPYGKPAGLAAPQIGIPLRIIIIQIPSEAKQKRVAVYDTLPPTIFINPTYTPIKTEGTYKDWEGCYSVPNKMGQVKRYSAIHFSAYTEDGKKVSRIARGFLARLLQHEIDHLNGHTYVDYHCSDCHFGSEQDMLKIKSMNEL